MKETIEPVIEEVKETIEPVIEKTKEPEIEPEIEEKKEPYHDNNWDLVYLRNTRNKLLELTDKYLLPDYPITPENLEIIKAYRQTLRDFINNNKEGILNGVIVELPPIPFKMIFFYFLIYNSYKCQI